MLKKLFKYLVIFLSGLALLVVLAIYWQERPLHLPKTPQALAFTNVALVDTRAGKVVPNMTLLVDNGKITAIGSNEMVLPANVRKIDATGKFLIPGLMDMHIHSWFEMSSFLDYPLYIANGVTSVRDMAGCTNPAAPFFACTQTKQAWTRDAIQGKMIGPRVLASGSFPIELASHVTQGIDNIGNTISPATPQDARQLVRKAHAEKWDFIKVYNQLPVPIYDALMAEAKLLGVVVAGHLPRQISLEHAVRAGQKSIEHAALFPLECSSAMEGLRAQENAVNGVELLRQTQNRHDDARCQQLFALMAQHGTWFTPTHITRRFEAHVNDAAYLDDARKQYIPYGWRLTWHLDAKRMQKHHAKPGAAQLFKQFYLDGLRLTGEAHRAGVPILAGTDAPDSYAFPGLSMHDELQELVKGGLSPAAALQSATLNPARFLGLEQQYGTLEVGKHADLVLLNANPLQDIANTRQIAAVVFNGVMYEEKDLQTMHDYVKQQAGSFSVLAKSALSLLRSQEFRNMFAD